MIQYGNAPESIGVFDLDFTEYMHYMYLPVQFAEFGWALRLPANLAFAQDFVEDVISDEFRRHGRNHWQYVYVTARRGFATPGNPLNRPGWHADGFGKDDINYVWTDRFPTLFAEGEFWRISADHVVSVKQFTDQANDPTRYPWGEDREQPIRLTTYPDKTLQRLDASVIHAAPEIPAPGGERSFFKVSFSNERYNLVGNSHNHLFDYDWPMFTREQVRNDPARPSDDSKAVVL